LQFVITIRIDAIKNLAFIGFMIIIVVTTTITIIIESLVTFTLPHTFIFQVLYLAKEARQAYFPILCYLLCQNHYHCQHFETNFNPHHYYHLWLHASSFLAFSFTSPYLSTSRILLTHLISIFSSRSFFSFFLVLIPLDHPIFLALVPIIIVVEINFIPNFILIMAESLTYFPFLHVFRCYPHFYLLSRNPQLGYYLLNDLLGFIFPLLSFKVLNFSFLLQHFLILNLEYFSQLLIIVSFSHAHPLNFLPLPQRLYSHIFSYIIEISFFLDLFAWQEAWP